MSTAVKVNVAWPRPASARSSPGRGQARRSDLSPLPDTAGLEEADATVGRMRPDRGEADPHRRRRSPSVIDARTGLDPATRQAFLRRYAPPHRRTLPPTAPRAGLEEAGAWEAGTGFGDPVAPPGTGEGMADLYEALVTACRRPSTEWGRQHAAAETGHAGVPRPTRNAHRPLAADSRRAPHDAAAGTAPSPAALFAGVKSMLIKSGLIGEDRSMTGPAASPATRFGRLGMKRRPVKLPSTPPACAASRVRVQDKFSREAFRSPTPQARCARRGRGGLSRRHHSSSSRDLQIVDLVVKEGRALVIAPQQSGIEDRVTAWKTMCAETQQDRSAAAGAWRRWCASPA